MATCSEKELQDAREYAAGFDYSLADAMLRPDFGFAAHVTEEMKLKYSAERRVYGDEIAAGLHDNNLTVQQRMIYFLTGKSYPLLP